MGKTFKENKSKWKHNKDFQKKQQKKTHTHKGNKVYSPFDDTPEYHEKWAGS